ncbi:MAG: bile acid:sodium symporter family protein, partial [Actinomycetota bacterium]|nr:bile acid:sodium symporter family protein [Actinomycetota bacterium]
MNDSVLISVGLPIALAIIMFGLGLSLEVGDFRRVARTPRAVVVALG